MSLKRISLQVGRREFLKTGARGVTAGVLVLIGVSLVRRKGSGEARLSPCPADFSCRKCNKKSACSEPKAEAFKVDMSSRTKNSSFREKGGLK